MYCVASVLGGVYEFVIFAVRGSRVTKQAAIARLLAHLAGLLEHEFPLLFYTPPLNPYARPKSIKTAYIPRWRGEATSLGAEVPKKNQID